MQQQDKQDRFDAGVTVQSIPPPDYTPGIIWSVTPGHLSTPIRQTSPQQEMRMVGRRRGGKGRLARAL